MALFTYTASALFKGKKKQKEKPWQDDECISTKHVTAVTAETDILLSQSSVCVSVLIKHPSYRAAPSNAPLATSQKREATILAYSGLTQAVATLCGACHFWHYGCNRYVPLLKNIVMHFACGLPSLVTESFSKASSVATV